MIIARAQTGANIRRREGARARSASLSLATVLTLFAAVLSGCLSTPAAPPQPSPPRDSRIPADAVKALPADDAHPPVLHGRGWRQPVPVPGAVNTAGGEDSPFVTPDGQTLYFFFTPDVSVLAQEQLLDGVTGIYVARLQDGAWGQVQRVLLQDGGKLALDGCPFVQGSTIWFCSAREGYTGVHLFTAQQVAGAWRDWRTVADQFGADYEVGELHVTADGTELYYHSPRAGGAGQFDIWVTRRVEGQWQPPENVTAANSPETDGWPFVSQDGKELWFTRTYGGSPAVFRALRGEGGWGTPELIVSQFAGEPTLDVEGNLYFVHHYYRDGAMLEADIYVAYRDDR